MALTLFNSESKTLYRVSEGDGVYFKMVQEWKTNQTTPQHFSWFNLD